MRQLLAMLLVLAALGGCAQIAGVFPDAKRAPDKLTEPTIRPPTQPGAAELPATGARTVDEFDTTTADEKSAAQSAGGAGGRDLGLTIASLGAPGEPGFWLKTPLVRATAKGRVEDPVTGKFVQVDLIPLAGAKTAGSRMSLGAMRLIGADLTGLPELRVFRLPG